MLRAYGNYDVDAASLEVSVDFSDDEGLTQQSFRDECDINVILERFGVSAHLPVSARMPMSGDFTGIGSFADALNAVIAARESFAAMSPDVRARFGNDPGRFVDFFSDEKNRPEAVRLGLVVEPLPKPDSGPTVAVLSSGTVADVVGSVE